MPTAHCAIAFYPFHQKAIALASPDPYLAPFSVRLEKPGFLNTHHKSAIAPNILYSDTPETRFL
ncbi:hypothetical protein [Argonema galeatum]|uniref:hypothetical protein n=1 Tax=Argonema galeatum TaxID=2942762 RepID=UPI002012AF4F|nr:hypothetical protein [Argonema galeatum]MCL1465218.1 hypothetical protein [Argonema galeatum A003/A1]